MTRPWWWRIVDAVAWRIVDAWRSLRCRLGFHMGRIVRWRRILWHRCDYCGAGSSAYGDRVAHIPLPETDE